MTHNSAALHSDSLIIDAACPGDYWRCHIDDRVVGGVTVSAVTVGSPQGLAESVYDLAEMFRLVRTDPRLSLCMTTGDIRRVQAEGGHGVVFHFQGTQPLEYEADLLEVYYRLGVRVIQMAYNRRNPLCDGCEEPRDAGLSLLGRRMVTEMNRLGILIDVSHTGERSSLETLDASAHACVASHSNAAAIHANARNLSDPLIRAIAASGGVIGINGFPSFVSNALPPTLDDFIDHIAYIGDLVGLEHVGLGIDYYEATEHDYQAHISSGLWDSNNYPPPPYEFPRGISVPRTMPALTARLIHRGFHEDEIRGVLGENWLRVYDEVWAS